MTRCRIRFQPAPEAGTIAEIYKSPTGKWGVRQFGRTIHRAQFNRDTAEFVAVLATMKAMKKGGRR